MSATIQSSSSLLKQTDRQTHLSQGLSPPYLGSCKSNAHSFGQNPPNIGSLEHKLHTGDPLMTMKNRSSSEPRDLTQKQKPNNTGQQGNMPSPPPSPLSQLQHLTHFSSYHIPIDHTNACRRSTGRHQQQQQKTYHHFIPAVAKNYKIKINKIKTITKLAEVSEEEKIRTKSGLFLLLHSPSSFQIHYSRLNHAAAAAAAVICLSQQQHNFT
jgi:hypothetical protein